MKIFSLLLVVTPLISSLSLAQNNENQQEVARIKNIQTNDGIIAASLVFKLKCLLSGEMGFLSENDKTPAVHSLAKAFQSYAKDLDHLSKTKHGIQLKKEGLELLDFLNEVIIKTANPVSTEKETKEFEQYLKKHGLKIHDGIAPIELANLVSKKITAYNKQAGGPEWTFNSQIKAQK